MTSSLPLRAAIAQSKLLPARYRKQLLRTPDAVLLAILKLCTSKPDWSAGRISAALQAEYPGLQERIVAELRKVIGVKHAKRRGGVREALGPERERLMLNCCGYVLGAWYDGREVGAMARQLAGVGINDAGQFVAAYRLADRPRVFHTSYHSWRQWVGKRIDPPATSCRSGEMTENALDVQGLHAVSVECAAA